MKDQCKNCNTLLQGKFCYECGQKTITVSDRTLRFLVYDVFHFITHLDSKFIKTLVTIFRQPGLITKHISEGISVRYFNLTSLFLIGTLIYFLLPTSVIGFGFLNNPFDAQLENGFFMDWKRSLAEHVVNRKHIDMATLATGYDEKLQGFGKLFTIIMIPMTIPVLWLVNICIRWFKKDHDYTAYDLGTASLEINSLILFTMFIIIQGLAGVINWLFSHPAIMSTAAICGGITLLVMIYLFFRNAYQIRWWMSALAVMVFFMGYILAIEIYRVISFVVFI